MFDAECVSCHTTGFEYTRRCRSRPRRRPTSRATSARTATGPASKHVADPDNPDYRQAVARSAEEPTRTASASTATTRTTRPTSTSKYVRPDRPQGARPLRRPEGPQGSRRPGTGRVAGPDLIDRPWVGPALRIGIPGHRCPYPTSPERSPAMSRRPEFEARSVRRPSTARTTRTRSTTSSTSASAGRWCALAVILAAVPALLVARPLPAAATP